MFSELIQTERKREGELISFSAFILEKASDWNFDCAMDSTHGEVSIKISKENHSKSHLHDIKKRFPIHINKCFKGHRIYFYFI